MRYFSNLLTAAKNLNVRFWFFFHNAFFSTQCRKLTCAVNISIESIPLLTSTVIWPWRINTSMFTGFSILTFIKVLTRVWCSVQSITGWADAFITPLCVYTGMRASPSICQTFVYVLENKKNDIKVCVLSDGCNYFHLNVQTVFTWHPFSL